MLMTEQPAFERRLRR